MCFFVVAEQPEIKIFNRVASAGRALTLAARRREEGARGVFVFDATWCLIEAPVLRTAAHAELDMTSELNEVTSETVIKVGSGKGAEPTRAADLVKLTGRVRVFRGRRPETK